MKRTFFVITLIIITLLITRSSFAQPWTYDASWSLPQTPATQAVRAALDRGLVGQPGIDFINSLGEHAIVVPAGSPWPCTACVQWYAKSDGADGKYQWPAADGPYPQGWEIRWDPTSWSPGSPGVNGQPTRWQFHPFAGPTFVPPAPPASPPLPAPPALPAPDLSPVIAELATLAANVEAVDDKVTQLASDEAAFRDEVRSQWRRVSEFAVKYIAPILGGIVAAIAAK